MAKCPVCQKKPIAEFKPFCSKRCQDADLAAWVTEKYRVKTEEQAGDFTQSEDDDNLH